MRIVITYERADILKLVEADLKARDMAVKAGTTLAYKGALQVKLEVETEDPVAPTASVEAAHPELVRREPPPPPEESVDMADVLAASQRLAKTQPAPLGRRLHAGESLEYPKG